MAIPCKGQSTEVAVSAIQQHGRAYDRPEMILFDQGAQFTSPVFKQNLEDLGIGHITTLAYHTQANSAVERCHRTIYEMLRRISTETTSPLLALQKAVDSYNNLPHSTSCSFSTGKTHQNELHALKYWSLWNSKRISASPARAHQRSY